MEVKNSSMTVICPRQARLVSAGVYVSPKPKSIGHFIATVGLNSLIQILSNKLAECNQELEYAIGI